jgi:exportin-T
MVRAKAWYLFLRFVRGLRGHLGEVSQTIIQAIGDLLVIKASLPEDRDDDDDDEDNNDPDRDPIFDSQIHLFEAVGCISSAGSIPVQTKILYLQSIMNPVFADMEQNINAAKNGEDRALLQMEHDIRALGTLARGYTDWMPGVKTAAPPPNEVSEEFMRAAEVILVALESLTTFSMIREAARFSFARLVGGCGTSIFVQLPRWMEGLLSHAASSDEMTFFLSLLRQVVFAFKSEIFTVLDAVLTPLLRRVFERLSETPTGTDDEIQLRVLRREYLNFVLVILNHDLGGVFVSASK